MLRERIFLASQDCICCLLRTTVTYRRVTYHSKLPSGSNEPSPQKASVPRAPRPDRGGGSATLCRAWLRRHPPRRHRGCGAGDEARAVPPLRLEESALSRPPCQTSRATAAVRRARHDGRAVRRALAGAPRRLVRVRPRPALCLAPDLSRHHWRSRDSGLPRRGAGGGTRRSRRTSPSPAGALDPPTRTRAHGRAAAKRDGGTDPLVARPPRAAAPGHRRPRDPSLARATGVAF